MATTQLLLPLALAIFAPDADPASAGAARAGFADECIVSGSAATAADVIRARAACEAARERFAALFGEAAPVAHVALHDGAGYEVGLADSVGVVFWPNSTALGNGAADAARHGGGRGIMSAPTSRRESLQWDEVLPHEIAHALTLARFFGGTVIPEHDGYGTPLPDWFEEGIAIWSEPAASRAARVAQARALPRERRDLESILHAVHPAAGRHATAAALPGAAPSRDQRLRDFYPQAIAVLSFVHELGGPAAVRELGRRLMHDAADPRPLAGLPGLPGDMGAVVEAWDRWIGTR
jgi:hypothetical protein